MDFISDAIQAINYMLFELADRKATSVIKDELIALGYDVTNVYFGPPDSDSIIIVKEDKEYTFSFTLVPEAFSVVTKGLK